MHLVAIATVQLYIDINKNNMLHVIRYLFLELLFVYLFLFFFLPNADVIMTLLQYFVCCIILSAMKISFGKH